jgi:hypothetical protein
VLYALAADLVVIGHFAFVFAAVVGGLAALRWPRLTWGHLPMVLWAAGVELFGWSCPLTPLEQGLRQAAGQAGYSGGFLDQYLWTLLYPQGLTRTHQVLLGGALVAFNGWIYLRLWRRRRHSA